MESKKIAGLLVYLSKKVGFEIENWVKDAANNGGDKEILNFLLVKEFDKLNERQQELILSKKDKKAKDLAEWYNAL